VGTYVSNVGTYVLYIYVLYFDPLIKKVPAVLNLDKTELSDFILPRLPYEEQKFGQTPVGLCAQLNSVHYLQPHVPQKH